MKTIKEIEKELKSIFEHYEDIALFNQEKVLSAFQKCRVSTQHFAGTTGYGYNDIGRDTLAKVYAEVFGAETAIVSPLITCGSHALAIGLFGILRPGDCMLSVTGKPYDTMDEVIFGKAGQDIGSLSDFNIRYEQVDLANGNINLTAIQEWISKNGIPKMFYFQRSRGYSDRKAFSCEQIGTAINAIKTMVGDKAQPFYVVDNCYGEFLEKTEPTQHGADLCIGSLIKNVGGGIAQTGGYLVGTQRAVHLAATRFTSPSLQTEVGSYELGFRMFYQGLFLAPHTVLQTVKGSYLIGEVMAQKGLRVFPASNEKTYDIVKSIVFPSSESLIRFVQIIQKFSPVDSFVTPLPWAMPGYVDEVIMAAGTFVAGSSIELSCDSPVRPPYIAYLQGGLTYEHLKLVATHLFNDFKL